jgi:hypothetical protein
MNFYEFMNKADAFVKSAIYQTHKAWLMGVGVLILLIVAIWEMIDKAKRGRE